MDDNTERRKEETFEALKQVSPVVATQLMTLEATITKEKKSILDLELKYKIESFRILARNNADMRELFNITKMLEFSVKRLEADIKEEKQKRWDAVKEIVVQRFKNEKIVPRWGMPAKHITPPTRDLKG
jgi:hypothetical protein